MPLGLMPKKWRRGSAEPLKPLYEDSEALFADEPEVDLDELVADTFATSTTAALGSGSISPSSSRSSSWNDSGIPGSIIPGPDGHGSFPSPTGPPGAHPSYPSPIPGYDGHGVGGDISKCPFAALVMNLDGSIYSKVMSAPAQGSL